MRQTLVWALISIAFIAPTYVDGPTRITFDDQPADPSGTPGVSLAADAHDALGVRFGVVTVLEYEPGFTSSGRNGIEMCYSAEFCTAPFRIDFDRAQVSVAANIGFDGSLDSASAVTIHGYDEFGDSVASDQAILGPGGPIYVADTTLRAHDPDGRITAVEVRWADPQRVMNNLVLDDVVFEPFVPDTEVTADPAAIDVTLTEANLHVETLTLANTGNVATFFDLAVEPTQSPFQIVATTCHGMLNPSEECSIDLAFEPVSEQEHVAALVLRPVSGSPDGTNIRTVELRGRLSISEPPVETTEATVDTSKATSTAPATTEPSAATTEVAADHTSITDVPETTTVIETTVSEGADETTTTTELLLEEDTGKQAVVPTTSDDDSGSGWGFLFIVAGVVVMARRLTGRRKATTGESGSAPTPPAVVTSVMVRHRALRSQLRSPGGLDLTVRAVIDPRAWKSAIRQKGATS